VRITFVLPVVSLGGGSRVIAIYAQELVRRGHDVCLVSVPPRPISLPEKLRSWMKGFKGRAPSQESHLDDLGLDWRVLSRWRQIRNDDVPNGDVVVATWWRTAEWVSALSDQKGAKVYFIQGHEVFPHLPIDRSRATYRLPFHQIVVAKWLKRLLEEEYQQAEIDVVPNSVDKSQFFSSPRSKQRVPTIGLLYSAAELKGVDTAIAAIRIVRERVPELRIVSFGEIEMLPELALEGVEYFLRPPQSQIREIYAACDVWLSASRSEGFNLPAMEAMACRTPVVSTKTGWPEEVIQSGWNGWLAGIDDVQELARGLEWIVTREDDVWRELSNNSHMTVADSSWEASAALFERALERACKRAAAGEIAGHAQYVG